MNSNFDDTLVLSFVGQTRYVHKEMLSLTQDTGRVVYIKVIGEGVGQLKNKALKRKKNAAINNFPGIASQFAMHFLYDCHTKYFLCSSFLP